MAGLWRDGLWRPARDIPFLVFSAAIVLSMRRAVDEPSVQVGIGGTDVSLVPADIALALLAILAAARLLGSGSLPRPARAITYAAVAFSAWLLISSATAGLDAFVGAGKLLEYGLLGLGAVLFVRRRAHLWLLVALLVAVSVAATVVGSLQFFDVSPINGNPGKRQPSFLGEHDFAALSTLSLTLALACLYAPAHRLRRLPLVAGVVGTIGVILGAALASLIGLYLGIAAIVGLAAARKAVTHRALALTALAVVVTTAGVLALRSGDLGSILRYLGIEEHEEEAGAYAASWSQRLIYIYVGGRMFLDSPVTGVGWYGTIPASKYAEHLPDARERFPGQPARYFPAVDGEFIPQQTYDQILYELGAVGAVLFLTLGAFTVRTSLAVGRAWPRGDPDEPAAYLPAAWVGALIGGLAGAALFGGIPQTAIFWLTLGVAALTPSLVPPRAVPPRLAEQPELVAAAR